MLQDKICDHLADNNFGVVGTSIFSYQRDEPDEAVFVRVYDSPAAEWHQASGLTRDEMPKIQIMVRGESDLAVETKARAIHALLHSRHSVIQGANIAYMQALQHPTPLGRDSRNRAMYVFNLEVKTYE
jgi:hypothetical protein